MSSCTWKAGIWSMVGVSAVAMLTAFVAAPVRAIDVFQAEQPEVYTADPVKVDPPAKQIQRDQARQVDKHEAESVGEYIGQTVQPDQPASDSGPSRRVQSGLMRYIAPGDWKRVDDKGTVVFVPPTIRKDDPFVALMLLPVQTLQGDFQSWFVANSRDKLAKDVRIVQSSATKVMTTTAGETLLLSTLVTRKTLGDCVYVSYVGVHRKGRVQMVAYLSSDPEQFAKYLPEFQVFMQSLDIVAENPVSDAPGPSDPPSNVKPTPDNNTHSVNPPARRVANGNAVEPLSNGLLLTTDATGMMNKLGEPTQDDRFVGGGIDFPECGAMFSANGDQIWHFTMHRGVQLNCGIGVGSTRQDINAVFGAGTSVHGDTTIVYDQYRLMFSFDGDVITRIKIDPSRGAFRPYRRIPFGNGQGKASQRTPDPSTDKPQGGAKVSSKSFVGTWQGIASTVGSIVLHPDGTYTMNGKKGDGRYKVSGNQLTFTGTLASWNGGHGVVKDGVLEFQWQENNVPYWFTYAKVD